MDDLDCAVIGGGVVGLAVARALALAGREVMVLEAEGAIGTGTSSRNSEVIHAGIYYPQASLKARLCVEGKQLLYAYAEARGVPHRRCGKLIVATSAEQVAQLEAIRLKAAANGVDDLETISAAQAVALEPQLRCMAALVSPSTGIVDSHALMLSLLGDLENAGGMLALKSAVRRADLEEGGIVLTAQDGTRLRCRSVVNAAGLGAPDLARHFGGLATETVPTAYFAKGNYFTLSGRAPFGRLVYPVPEPGGLGVHLTIDLGGQAKFGPDVQWVSSPDDLVVDPARGDAFYAEVRKYWPALPDGALIPGYAGMRPKISGPGDPAADFRIDGPRAHGVRGLVNLFGIESPGLTSSLAIGRHVADLLAAED
ncbi:FAD-dependent oxidoreductase [Variovorax paradoxus]|jgi:L-2-hydroxyglutarate oxidase LhgO|uniref:NAD(P)/FAD-dependent oxidoreductase n=1 Tax=Variovorax paradoxus TaxID=34073 RepID=UPI0006E571E9|nr:FAD-dependent oxidoreductase [Variovorax paradoxus]KPU99230.1 FAD-dependent oxidoreductase [Variovorax paradoxus]KPV05879.1 FAD-dependent oxidoreductase [Variovorax paradoxus]KPV08972.1 FAD-dependent oxidoreductase [Variovorax paradoxus]KPV22284.1 FAD-dependent oxidoreductase [Variovorax paradoxus]